MVVTHEKPWPSQLALSGSLCLFQTECLELSIHNDDGGVNACRMGLQTPAYSAHCLGSFFYASSARVKWKS